MNIFLFRLINYQLFMLYVHLEIWRQRISFLRRRVQWRSVILVFQKWCPLQTREPIRSSGLRITSVLKWWIFSRIIQWHPNILWLLYLYLFIWKILQIFYVKEKKTWFVYKAILSPFSEWKYLIGYFLVQP